MKKQGGLLLAAVVIVILCMVVVIYTGQSQKAEQGNDSALAGAWDEESKDADITVISEGESLIIPVDEITTNASFLPVEVDGTRMEVIAVRGSDGTIRTAFNTCQICYGSGRGYYVQQDDVFVCQNCGNRFTVDQIEIQTGGCNPWPIFEEDKIITDETIEITYDFLSASKAIFENWKVSY